MKVRLFADERPNGRCLMLAHQLSQATTLPPPECIRLAERLFDFAHRRANPAVIEVSDAEAAAALAATCDEVGIAFEEERAEDI